MTVHSKLHKHGKAKIVHVGGMMSQWQLHDKFKGILANNPDKKDLKTLLTDNKITADVAEKIAKRVGNKATAWKVTNAALREVDGNRSICGGKGLKDRSLTPREQRCLMGESAAASNSSSKDIDVSDAEKKLKFIYDANPGLEDAEKKIAAAGARDDLIRNKVCAKSRTALNRDLADKCELYTPDAYAAYMTGSGDMKNGYADWNKIYPEHKSAALAELNKPSIPVNEVKKYKQKVKSIESYPSYFNEIANALTNAEKGNFSEGEIDNELKKLEPAKLMTLKQKAWTIFSMGNGAF